MDLVLSRRFMSYYCILFFGLSTVLRAFLAFIKSGGFGPFSQIYELLHTVLGFVDSFEGISGIYQNWWIWSFLFVLWAILFCFGVRRQFQGPVWHLSKLVDLALYRSFMSYCKLFWGPSTVSRAFLAAVKTRGFGPFSQVYEQIGRASCRERVYVLV